MPTLVRVRMKVCQAGPGVFRRPGHVYEVDGEEAGSMVAAGVASLEPTPPKVAPAAAPPPGDPAAERTTADAPPESSSGAPADKADAPPASGAKPKGGRRGGRA